MYIYRFLPKKSNKNKFKWKKKLTSKFEAERRKDKSALYRLIRWKMDYGCHFYGKLWVGSDQGSDWICQPKLDWWSDLISWFSYRADSDPKVRLASANSESGLPNLTRNQPIFGNNGWVYLGSSWWENSSGFLKEGREKYRNG